MTLTLSDHHDDRHLISPRCLGDSQSIKIVSLTHRAGRPEKGLVLLFDIRQHLTPEDVYSSRTRLLLANLHSPEEKPVVVGLINLAETSSSSCY